MATPTPKISNRILDGTIGAFLLGAVVGAFIQGINNGQAVFYFKHSQSDPKLMRCLVFFVWAINVVHLFLVVDSAYIYTVNYHSDPPALDRQTWSGMGILLVSTISDLGQKGIFSYRVWRLSRKWYLCAIIMTSALVTFVFALFTMIKMIMSPTLSASPVGTFGSLISLAASDIVMSIILASVFWRRRSVFPTVNRVLRLVILYSMETALITSVGATAGVVMFAAIPSLPVFTAVLWILPNLILSSLFVALNARQGLRAQNVIIMSPIQRSHETEVSCISHS